MGIAEEMAKASPATRLQVGCVLYLSNHTLTIGFNGMPSGSPTEVCETSEDTTKEDVIHAEANALKKLYDTHCSDLSNGAFVFVTHAPCLDCSQKLIRARVKKVFYKHIYRCSKGIENLQANGVEIERIEDSNDLPS